MFTEKSYQAISEEAGMTVEAVREIAKTIYKDATGWHEAGHENTEPGAACYRTKAEAIKAVAKRMKAEVAEASKAETGLSLETLAEMLSEVNPGGVTVDDIVTSYVHECVTDNGVGSEGGSYGNGQR